MFNKDYLKEVDKQEPKCKLGIRIEQFFHNIWGKFIGEETGLLMTPEEYIYSRRKRTLDGAYNYAIEKCQEYDLEKMSNFLGSVHFITTALLFIVGLA